jgi:CRP-like cAMP-binding protein
MDSRFVPTEDASRLSSRLGMGVGPWRGKANSASFDPDVFLATVNHGRCISEYGAGRVIFSQGDAADSVFYIARGKIKIVVTSEQGREAVVGLSARRTFSAKAV